MTTHHKYLIGLTTVVVLAGGIAAYAASRPAPAEPIDPVATASPTPTPPPNSVALVDRPVAAASQPTGRIAGRRIFPGEGIPADFTTCAINLDSGQATCIGGNQPEYQLTVAPGQYQVYAIVPSFSPRYQAYYNRFVTCGLRETCTDHAPITVTVPAGGVASGIDVGDFYQ